MSNSTNIKAITITNNISNRLFLLLILGSHQSSLFVRSNKSSRWFVAVFPLEETATNHHEELFQWKRGGALWNFFYIILQNFTLALFPLSRSKQAITKTYQHIRIKPS
jgi:hypothetical protein